MVLISLKLPIIESSPKTKPRYEVVPSPGPTKQVTEEGNAARARQKTPLSDVIRRSSFPGRIRQANPNSVRTVAESLKIDNGEMAQESESIGLMGKTPPTHVPQEVKHESGRVLKVPRRVTRPDSSNSVSSSLSMQSFELSDHATAPFQSLLEQATHDCEATSHLEQFGSHRSSSASASISYFEMREDNSSNDTFRQPEVSDTEHYELHHPSCASASILHFHMPE